MLDMKWAFIDYENVGSLESLKLGNYERLIVFLGPKHKKLNMGVIPTDSFSHLEVIRMEKTGNNNLDFHLSFYLGLHHHQADSKTTFHVVSNDKGFDGLIEHLNKLGRTCLRKGMTKKKSAKKAAKKATKKVAKKTSKKTAKKAVKKVAKQAVAEANPLKTNNAEDQPPLAYHMHQKILKIPNEKRPRTKSSLTKWIINSSSATDAQARAACDRMIKSGFVGVDERGSELTWSLI